MARLGFQLEKVETLGRARAGRFKTLHNEVLTPLFMPVGTHATVRGQRIECLEDSGSQILLANTYHLLLRPGAAVFRKFGGIHRFMQWPRSVLTDSGGFQIFAMPNERVMSEEGARFLSYVDGTHIHLTPELSIETQRAIGSDIMMALDQCVPSTVPQAEARAAMELSNRWALRSLAARGDSPQSLFAIVQGACYPDLRTEAAGFLSQQPFDGFALGGLAVGESRQEREDTVEHSAALLPAHLPRYLMGVGTPIDLLEAVARGMDMFDCIIPTAHAEQGVAYSWNGKVVLKRGVYKEADEPIDPNCGCTACRKYSRAYLFHLIKTQEPMGCQLIGAHNIQFYHDLMRQMRFHILADSFQPFYRAQREVLAVSDLANPVKQARPRRQRSMEKGDYRVLVAPAGFASIEQRSSGEVMHSVIPPAEEAKALYVEQSRLVERVAEVTPLVIWDVGMGAAANTMAAIHAYEAAAAAGSAKAPLQIVSFENDLDSLRLANSHLDHFHYLRHAAPNAILQNREWKSRKYSLQWRLQEGNFLELLEQAPVPDIIFFDPFSFRTNRDLWCLETFARIYAYTQSHSQSQAALELFTYSSSTAVRASLLLAGFYVAKGAATGPKGETTIACTAGALSWRRGQLLGNEWLERWARSEAKGPLLSVASGVETEAVWALRLKSHSQFTSSKLAVES